MALHKNHSRSQLVIEKANTFGRKLGKDQIGVLKSLLERGTFPGTWYWSSASVTHRCLTSLAKRRLVEKQEVELTDMRGEPDPSGRTTTYYRPAQWMRAVMDAPTEEDVRFILEGVVPQ